MLKISFKAHKDQVDKSGLPYVYHPFHLAEQMNDECSICVALLHDVVEDTDISLDDLASDGFPAEVIEALTLMTHNDNVPYMDYVRKIKTNPIAAKVKLADLEHNSDLTRLDLVDDAALERADKYRRAIFLLRFGEAPKSPTKIIRAWHTPCCGIKVPIEYARCSMCGKEIVNAEEMLKKPRWKLQQMKQFRFAWNAAKICGSAIITAVSAEQEALGGRRNRSCLEIESEVSLDSVSGKALISDDTQMTLFTAEGIINWCSGNEGHRLEQLRFYENRAYQDWLTTQEIPFDNSCYDKKKARKTIPKGLMNVSELYSCRAPGITCLSALEKRKTQHLINSSFIEDKINNSKGSGSVMRAAPIGFLNYDIRELDMESAEIAAITHCHSLGYMPAAVLSHVIHGIIYNDNQMTLKEIVEDARDTVAKIFKNDEHVDELINIINDAIELSENNDSDLDNIHRLGEGWVSEEALAIALYCSLRYHYDFSECIIKAVNHKGDSDSTSAIAGNIIGTWVGYNEIESKWKDRLELADVIVELADNLFITLEKA